jgi:hypothetical protein
VPCQRHAADFVNRSPRRRPQAGGSDTTEI